MVAVNTVDGCTVNLLHLAGKSGPIVLFLHATGFHITCYTPLAQYFAQQRYQCWGIEFRGQGILPAPPGNLVNLYLSDLFSIVDAWSLKGAQVAIRAEAQRPGTFAAIYAYEPVLWPLEKDSRMSVQVQGRHHALAASARRRRSHFKSRQAAAQRFRARPPFSAFHAACFHQYIDNGLLEQEDGTCILVISPENEARWYLDAGAYGTAAGHDDLPQVQCPITIGVGGKREAPVDYLAIEGIKQAPRCPKGRSDSFEGLAHFGPFEDPFTVASRALFCFQASKHEAAWAALPPAKTVSAAQPKL